MKTTRELLRNLVLNAREHCCGDAPRDKFPLLKDIDGALSFARKVEADMLLRNKLREVRRIIVKSKRYADRLPADELLCEIVNVDLK